MNLLVTLITVKYNVCVYACVCVFVYMYCSLRLAELVSHALYIQCGDLEQM